MPERRARRYPRAVRVNELLREILAEELELVEDGDERLGLSTITAVDADTDLRRATVFLSSLSEEAAAALVEHRPRLQAAIARQARLKRTPQLSFVPDPGVAQGARVEGILRELRQHGGE
ncbi:MAG: ribosome-binding factor [Acidimicrobiaceae bacterium]|nr:ribosome-binding factor [Acidimicrobiaceae bacterium]